MKSNGKRTAQFPKKRFTRNKLTALLLSLVMVFTVIGSLAIFSDRVTTQVSFRTFVLTLDDYTLETGYLPGPYIAGETVPVTITESNPGADLESVITMSITWTSPDDECKIFGHPNAADNAVIKIGDAVIEVTPEMLSNDNNTVTFDLPAHALPNGSVDVTRNLTLQIPGSLMGTGDISYTYDQVTLTPTGEGEPKVIPAEDLTGHNFTVRVGWAASDQQANNGKNLMGFLVAGENEGEYEIQFEFPYDTCDESAMRDFAARDAAKWYHYKDDVVELHFIEGMTSIGNYAFPDFSKVTAVEFPTTVADIGISAFDNAGLTGELVIPATVKNIESLAFGNLEDVDEITFLHTTNDLSLPKNREEGKEETGAFYVSEHVETTVNSTVPGILYEYGWHDGWDNRRGIPMLNDGDSWHRTWVDYDYTTPVDESALTSIQILDYYMPDGTESATWDASAYETVEGQEFNGKVTAYLKDEGKTLILAGNGYGLIHANPISTEAFCYLENVTEISDANLLDTRYTTNMESMFENCSSLESLDVHTWDVSKVTTMSYMFDDCGSLQEMDLSCNTATAKDGKRYYATGEYEAWNPVSLEDCSFMFSMYYIYDYENPDDPYARLTSVNVTGWETNSLTHPERMFMNCANMTEVPGISDWDMSQVETTEYMFYYCLSLNNLDVSKWDMGSNTSTYHMFYYCQSLPGVDISGWNMSSVTDTENMFYHCESFTELTIPASLSVINEGFASYCPMMTKITFLHKAEDTLTFPDGNYSAFYVENNLDDENPITYTENDPLRTKVYYEHEEVLNYNWRTDRRGWVVTVETVEGGSMTAEPTTAINGKTIALTPSPEDGNTYYGATATYLDEEGEEQSFQVTSNEFTMPMADVTVTPEFGRPLPMLNDRFYWRSTYNEETGEYNDSAIDVEQLNSIEIVDSYEPDPEADFYAIWDASDDTVPGTVTAYLSADRSHLTIAGNGSGFIYANPDSTGAFMGFLCPTITGVEVLDTSKMVIADVMFGACGLVESLKVGNWDVSKMESAKNMFLGCASVTDLDVSKWNTSSLKYAGIFDLGDMATYGLVNETGMFGGCWALPTLDVATKTVNAGTPEEYVAWDTSNLIDAHGMFAGCRSATELDVSKWNTSNLRNAQAMFWDVSLSSIPVDNWNTSSLEETVDMFRRCPNLTTVNVSKWDVSSLITTARMFYECPKLETMDFSTWDESVVQQTAEMFYGCTGLESVTLTGWNLSNIAMSESAGQPDARTHAMFEGCTSLQSLTIPASLTKFGENFAGSCTNLTEITFLHDADTEMWFYAAGPNGAFYAGDSFSAEKPLHTKVTTTNKDVLAYEWDKDLRGYKVSITEVTGATVTAQPAIAVAGQTVTLAVTPANGYSYNGATITYKDGGGVNRTISLNAGTTTFTMPDAPVTATTAFTMATYSLSFNANDGVMPSSVPKNYTAGTPTFALPKPTKADYDFAGWYTEPDFSDKPVTEIALGSAGDKAFYAKWNPKAYAMLYDDGTLVFQYGNTPDPDRGTLRTSFSGVTDTSRDRPDWSRNYASSITKVIVEDEIAPLTTWYWFQDLTKCTSMDLAKLDTSRTSNMYHMFYGCSSLAELDISGLDTSNVTDMREMFRGCSGLTELDVSSFNTAKVTDMGAMFYGCRGLAELDVSSFDTSSVTNMSSMFEGCSSLAELDVSSFDTALVTGMSYMFSGCSGLTSLDLSNFDTAKVTNMSYMFQNCSGLAELDVSSFDTAKVTNMVYMFYGCSGLKSLDVTGFNTTKVTGMVYMFYGCSGLTSLDVSGFDTALLTGMYNMFQNCSGLTELDVSGFDTAKVKNMSYMFSGCSGLAELDLSSFDTALVTNMSYMFQNCSGLTELDVSGFDTAKVTNMSYMFSGCSGLTSLDVSSFDTALVTNMSALFQNCSGLTELDVSSFNTAKVTDMSSMFKGCSGLTELDVSSFNTAKVTYMSYLFEDCSGLRSLDVSNITISHGPQISRMFAGCSGLTELDVSGFDTSKVTSLVGMFDGCSGLTELDVTNFNTSNVTSINALFAGCSSLTTLDLSSFNTAKVTGMGSVFEDCTNLQTIYVSNLWTNAKVTYANYTFQNCYSLPGYSSSKVSATYAKVSGGYLTYKAAPTN